MLGYTIALHVVSLTALPCVQMTIPERKLTVTVTCHDDIPHACYSSKTHDVIALGCMCLDRV